MSFKDQFSEIASRLQSLYNAKITIATFTIINLFVFVIVSFVPLFSTPSVIPSKQQLGFFSVSSPIFGIWIILGAITCFVMAILMVVNWSALEKIVSRPQLIERVSKAKKNLLFLLITPFVFMVLLVIFVLLNMSSFKGGNPSSIFMMGAGVLVVYILPMFVILYLYCLRGIQVLGVFAVGLKSRALVDKALHVKKHLNVFMGLYLTYLVFSFLFQLINPPTLLMTVSTTQTVISIIVSILFFVYHIYFITNYLGLFNQVKESFREKSF